MSEFSSLLASFKQNATAASSSSRSSRPSSTTQAQASTSLNQQQKHPRKRPHPNSNVYNARPPPSFPSMHSHVRTSLKGPSSFELSFLVIGAQKAGTSWLHTLLQKCDRISLPVEQKEVHFWDWHYRKGFHWYIRQFNFPQHEKKTEHHISSSLSTKNNNNNNNNSLFYGEITPCYVILNPPTISEIYKCFPDMKVVFVARDLVDRAWSAMVMELRDQTMGLNAGEFAEGVITAGSAGGRTNERTKKRAGTISVAQQRRLQQQCSPSSQPDSYYLDRLRSETHSSRSDYATHMRNWYSEFPAESILIVDYREIENNPRDALMRIAMHIGVEEKDARSYVEKLSDEEMKQRVNAATNTKSDVGGSNNVSKELTATWRSHYSLSQRPRLRKQMERLLCPHAKKFNLLLKEQGYGWKTNEYTD